MRLSVWIGSAIATGLVAMAITSGVACAADDDAGAGDPSLAAIIAAPPPVGPATGLADSAGLHATVFGTPPQDIAPLPARVPVVEINVALPWRQPIPQVLWFDSKLHVYFSAQKGPAPLAIIISGTGSDANTSNMQVLRGALYGAGYHVLTMPSPTFPGFIVAASSTGVAGDFQQDAHDLYGAMQEIVNHLPHKVRITDIDVLGYSLGGANAAFVKSIDAREGKLKIHRAVMINPPVSLFSSIGRLDKLFATSIGSSDEAIDRMYRSLYAQLANLYRATERVEMDQNFMLAAAAATLKTDADFSAAIALTFRLDLVDMFFIGDLYAHTGVVTDPRNPPKVGDSLENIQRALRLKPFSEYFARVFAPYYLKARPGSTSASLIADNRLNVIGDVLRANGDYYVLTNSNDLILDKRELAWLKDTLGKRIVVYDHGGHLGNLGERQQVADLLRMLDGTWPGSTT
jgi:hypothetical protein